MLKLIYLAKRKPGLTFDEFVCRWRKHGALGMSLPLWRFALGYVQAEPIRPAPLAGASDAFDAIACYMVADSMFTDMTDDDMPGALAMAEDELETFSGPIPDVSLWVNEERVKPGELGGTTAYLFYTDPASAREIAERSRDAAGLNRVVLNLRDDESHGPGASTLPYAAVVECAAPDLSTLASSVCIGGANLLTDADLAVVTREAVLWNRLP